MSARTDHIGWRSAPTRVQVDGWRVRLFCQAIGETDPVYWDPQAARAAGHRAPPVPPTFLKAIEGEHLTSAQLLQQMGIPLNGVLHAEQAFAHEATVHVGDTVEVTRQIASVEDKKDGALTLIAVHTTYSVEGRSVASSRQTIMVRNRIPQQEPA